MMSSSRMTMKLPAGMGLVAFTSSLSPKADVERAAIR